MTIKFLHESTDIEGEYYIPVKAKEIKIPVNEIHFPGKDSDLNRETYIKCTVRSMIQVTGQTMNIYTPENSSMNVIKTAMSSELD